MLTYNHSVLTNNGSWLTDGSVTPPAPSDEVTIGTQTWKNSYLSIDDGQGEVLVNYDNTGLNFYTYQAAVRICNANYPGYRPALSNDYNTLFNYTNITDLDKFKTLFDTNYGGTDLYGLKLRPMYYIYTNSDSTLRTYGKTTIQFGGWTTACLYCHDTSSTNYAYSANLVNNIATMQRFLAGTRTKYFIFRLIKD